MPTNTIAPSTRLAEFLGDETGTISVDWAVMAAAVCGCALATATVLITSTQAFETNVEATLKNNVSNVQATSGTGGNREVGEGGDESQEFGFAGISSVTSTSSARVQCGTLVVSCAQSAEIVSQQFMMTDGTVWTRMITSYADGASDDVSWLDDTGRATDDVPLLPDDIPTININ